METASCVKNDACLRIQEVKDKKGKLTTWQSRSGDSVEGLTHIIKEGTQFESNKAKRRCGRHKESGVNGRCKE